ncbi:MULTISPECIES: putative phage tail protein [Brevibacillus]|uniref:putative phage tail protein n=1 Tax=Brevibacillus TaxID=55080 RepID=UPI000E2ED777|nr:MULTISPECIES: putative phage tail protein [Brevibacillus]MED1790790.1 DUF2313 domain-containing protein [Brevibacillus laterosporus]RFB33420.1 DUF2313 domain-containing protein [Brevibacillus sp. VP]
MFNLVRQLTDTGLYHDSDVLSTGELQAYEKQLQDVLEWQEQLKNELALDTTDWLLPRWEEIYDLLPGISTKRERQLALLNKERAKGALTASKIIAFANDYGFTPKIIKKVRPFRYRIKIVGNKHFDLLRFNALLNKAEPSHQAHDYGMEDKTCNIQFITEKKPIINVASYQICNTFSSGGEYEL